MKVTPIGTYVLLKKYKEPEQKKLIITSNEQDKFPHQGVIIDVGVDCERTWSGVNRVRYVPYTEQHLGDDLFLIKEESIIAIIEE